MAGTTARCEFWFDRLSLPLSLAVNRPVPCLVLQWISDFWAYVVDYLTFSGFFSCRLDHYIYDYMIKKNMRGTSEIFKREAALTFETALPAGNVHFLCCGLPFDCSLFHVSALCRRK